MMCTTPKNARELQREQNFRILLPENRGAFQRVAAIFDEWFVQLKGVKACQNCSVLRPLRK